MSFMKKLAKGAQKAIGSVGDSVDKGTSTVSTGPTYILRYRTGTGTYLTNHFSQLTNLNARPSEVRSTLLYFGVKRYVYIYEDAHLLFVFLHGFFVTGIEGEKNGKKMRIFYIRCACPLPFFHKDSDARNCILKRISLNALFYFEKRIFLYFCQVFTLILSIKERIYRYYIKEPSKIPNPI